MLQKRKQQGYNQVTPYIMALTAIGYIVMGVYVIKRKWLLVPLTDIISYAMGFLVIAYGLFRGWRAYRTLSDTSND
jgi:hypothetical protein